MTFGRILMRIAPKQVKLLVGIREFGVRSGYYRSIRLGKPVDSIGNPLPWYTYGAISYLESLDFRHKHVFEYGCGNSTFFWSDRSLSVTSCENDLSWFQEIRDKAAPNCQVMYFSTEELYVKSIDTKHIEYDVIVIDGNWRDQCAAEALRFMKSWGMIILDNSDINPDICEMLRSSGLLQIDFSGFGPVNAYPWTTSMFLRDALAFQRSFRPR